MRGSVSQLCIGLISVTALVGVAVVSVLDMTGLVHDRELAQSMRINFGGIVAVTLTVLIAWGCASADKGE